MGASRLKDKLESAKLSDFGHNITNFNTWYEDIREHIIKEEGEGYSEYFRALFRAYATSSNQEFLEVIATKRRNWIQGELTQDYSYHDLMETARVTFNNLIEEGKSKHRTPKIKTTSPLQLRWSRPR